ncbi:MAG: carboxypeptidase-like regulatory domain-containing protein, partial [Segetibacter sp.]
FTPTFSQDKKLCTISGVVKDTQSKSPLAEAVVTISSDAFKGKKFTLTDSTGTYHVSDLPSGNYTIF